MTPSVEVREEKPQSSSNPGLEKGLDRSGREVFREAPEIREITDGLDALVQGRGEELTERDHASRVQEFCRCPVHGSSSSATTIHVSTCCL